MQIETSMSAVDQAKTLFNKPAPQAGHKGGSRLLAPVAPPGPQICRPVSVKHWDGRCETRGTACWGPPPVATAPAAGIARSRLRPLRVADADKLAATKKQEKEIHDALKQVEVRRRRSECGSAWAAAPTCTRLPLPFDPGRWLTRASPP